MKPITRHLRLFLSELVSLRVTDSRSSLVGTVIHTPVLAVIIVSCVWLLLVFIVNPVGEFPLNDDWSYARAVQSLVEHGHLELSGFTSMPLIAQVLWGALFCLHFGFSFTALRASTITLGLLGILASYWLFEETKANRSIALLATMVLVTNPLYFYLSLTFMTDVPFFTFSMFAFIFFIRTLRTERHSDMVLGYAFSLAAILTRQLGIVIPIAFLGAYLAKNRISFKSLVNTLVPTAAFASLLFAFPAILRRTIGLPALYNRSFEPIVEAAPLGWFQIPPVFADRLLVELIYLGLFLLPVLILLGLNTKQTSSRQMRRLSLLSGLILFVAILGFLLWQGRTMPLIGNNINDLGLGPALLRDTYLLRLPHWPTAPKELWLIVTIAAVLGCVVLIRHTGVEVIQISRSLRQGTKVVRVDTSLFLVLAIAIYSILIAITGFLDRYLIWLLPLLMCLVLAWKRLRIQVLSLSVFMIIISIYGFFALGGTHDYLAWNRARWKAAMDLVEKDGISYRNIDGGFEFNGWYGYDAGYHIVPSKSLWWVDEDHYVIAFGPMPGYIEIRHYPFQRWLPPTEGRILVLQRVGE